MRVVRHWNRLPKGGCECPNPERVPNQVVQGLKESGHLEVSCPRHRGCEYVTFKVHSDLNNL